MNKLLSAREWFSLFLIGFATVAAILPGAIFLLSGSLPDYWLSEGGVYETAGAVACLAAGVLCLACWRDLSKQRQKLAAFWMLLLALVCLFIAGEEISWGQHLFHFDTPSAVSANNFQKEFNLHNSTLIQSSNNKLSSLFFKLLLFYFILLPMLLVVFPSVDALLKRLQLPLPEMRIAVVALVAKLADIVNHRIVYGLSFENDDLHLGEGVESMLELCLLLLAIQCFRQTRLR